MRTILGAAALAALSGACGTAVNNAPPSDAAADQPGDAAGDAAPADASDVTVVCSANADCARGEICFYTGDCARPGVCGPGAGVPCSTDMVPFCGCDGRTFGASSVCPDRPYGGRGACAGSDAGAPDAD